MMVNIAAQRQQLLEVISRQCGAAAKVHWSIRATLETGHLIFGHIPCEMKPEVFHDILPKCFSLISLFSVTHERMPARLKHFVKRLRTVS